MKYLLLLSLFALSIPVQGGDIPPRYSERLPGNVKLSDGIHWNETENSAAMQSLADFFREQGITVNTGAATRKNIPIEFRREDSILFIPGEGRNGYSIRMTPSKITIEYQNPQGESLACRQLVSLFNKHASSGGLIRKNITLPCYEIRGWMTDDELIAFRWNGPGSLVPINATAVEMRITDPDKGWLCAENALVPVGYRESLCPGISFTYADLESERKRLQAMGLEVTPLFDLSEENEPFERVTGHPMLSVEGMRFVRMLLEDFFSHTEFSSAVFILPEGRYREQVEAITARFPQLTDIRFSAR